MAIFLKRVYEPWSKKDGVRILVDRLWPRGVSKAEAHIDRWAQDNAPTSDLRKWFDHDPEKWLEFQKKYRSELKDNASVLEIREQAKREDISLIYAAKDELHAHALVLKQALEE